MKRLVIILVLVCLLTCSCNTTAPPAESSAESSTEAVTTAATTETVTEEVPVEKFQPTEDNVIWSSLDSDYYKDFHDYNNITSSIFRRSSPGKINMDTESQKMLTQAEPDQRIAIALYLNASGKYDRHLDPFSRLPEDFKDRYVTRSNPFCYLCFMTPEEVSQLVVDSTTGGFILAVSYRAYLANLDVAKFFDTEIDDVPMMELPDEEFTPDADNAIWDNDKRGSYLDAESGEIVMPAIPTDYGRIDFSEALKEAVKEADDTERIAVAYFAFTREAAEDVVLPTEENLPGDYVDPFSNLPDGYKEKYVEVYGSVTVCFMTSEEISRLVVTPNMAISLATVGFEEYEGLNALRG